MVLYILSNAITFTQFKYVFTVLIFWGNIATLIITFKQKVEKY